jgi:broad specificity phosphatase PhoE
MRIYLLRHGQTAAGLDYDPGLRHPNPGLDDTGLRQAELLGRRLQNCGVEILYSSDLRRARETAQIVSRHTNTAILFKAQLREIEMGAIPVQGWKAYPDDYRAWQTHAADLPYPQGEAGADVRKRAWPLLEEIVRRHSQDVAIVTHAGLIMVVLSACLGLGLEKRFRFVSPAYCSISTLVYDAGDGMLKVEQVNETAHLGVLLEGNS